MRRVHRSWSNGESKARKIHSKPEEFNGLLSYLELYDVSLSRGSFGSRTYSRHAPQRNIGTSRALPAGQGVQTCAPRRPILREREPSSLRSSQVSAEVS